MTLIGVIFWNSKLPNKSQRCRQLCEQNISFSVIVHAAHNPNLLIIFMNKQWTEWKNVLYSAPFDGFLNFVETTLIGAKI